jgi:hypothetical protein
MGLLLGLASAVSSVLLRDAEFLLAWLPSTILGAIFGVLGGLISGVILTIVEPLLIRAGGSSVLTGLIIVVGTVVIGIVTFTI